MDAAEVLAQLRADAGLREMARALLLGEELLRLPETVARLAEGQAALQAEVARLAEGQAALQAEVARLAEGQAALQAEVARLAEGQAALQAEVARLAEGQAALQAEVARLAEGQAALQAEVARLAEGQAALQAEVARLAEGQAALQAEVARLAEGQAALQAAVADLVGSQASLERRMDRLQAEVGSLSRTLGGTAEEDALDALEHAVRVRGYTLLGEPSVMDLDGDGELDLAARVRDASGAELSILVEAKVRLRAREVRAWAARLADAGFLGSLAEAGIPGPYLAYAYGIRVYAEAREAASAAGIGVLSSRGEEVPPEAPAA